VSAGARQLKHIKRMLALIDRATSVWHIPVVGRAKGRLIRRLIERHGCARGIEIGSLIGYSAILIASAMPPKGRLVCVEANDFLGWMTRANVKEAGLAPKVKVVTGDALRVVPLLPGRFDFAFIDAAKEDYLDYLRQLEPKLVRGAVVVADNTGASFRRDVKPYLDYVRDPAGRYATREYAFDDDAMEVSVLTR
jgi:predicted O-methyltransferase YrrM